MIDIHCHILPRIDDGPESIEDALALARACVADGIEHVVATPHILPGRYDNRRAGIERATEVFRELLALHEIPLGIRFSAEVRLCEDVPELIADGQIPFLGEESGWRMMLLEFPDGLIPLGATNLVRMLAGLGIRPVIVHPERNKAVMEHPERMEAFVDLGCYLQVTAASVTGQFGPRVLAASDFLFREGWVTVVASDAHNLRGRPPRMREARAVLADRFGAERAAEWFEHAPARLCGMHRPAGA